MTTKIHKLTTLYNMQSHIAKSIVDKIDHYLPYTYVDEIIRRMKAKHDVDVTSQHIRDVKRYQIKNTLVLEVILQFAEENKKAQKKLEKYAIK
jgi:hypothetical protein